MRTDSEKIYKDYKLSRDSIQLVEVTVTKCFAEVDDNLDNEFSPDYAPVNLNLSHSCDWINDRTAKGYLRAKVSVLNENSEKPIAKFSIDVVGLFRAISNRKINRLEYTRRIELQLVPQLLPYVRSTLTTLSALLTIPPVVLPTMDIIRSIQKNGQS